MTRLSGKVALITGAAQGIGEAVARAFHREGAAVFLADLKAEAGQALAGELGTCAGKPGAPGPWFIKLDVGREEDWTAAFRTVKEKAGRLDILVNNAGLNIREPIERMRVEDLDTMLAVNVKGPFLGIKHALPLLREGGGGVILNTSSICGLVGHRFTPEAYTMVKGALTMLSKSIAVRCAKDNIRCHSVHPSTVETAQVREMLKDPARRAERVGEIPLGRLATVEDVAAAFVYLASDEAAFLNGVSLPVDGGLTAG